MGRDPEAEPRPRGRPRKRPADSQPKRSAIKAEGESEMVFGRTSKKRGPVVPPPEEGNAEEVFGGNAGAPSSSEVPSATWPTRATFAGRKKPTDKEAATLFDTRREKFYQLAPNTLWKDGKEREYWKLCVKYDSCEKGIEEFLKNEHVDPGSSHDHPGQSRGRGRAAAGRGKGRGRGANAKAAVLKESGRKRTRGKASVKN